LNTLKIVLGVAAVAMLIVAAVAWRGDQQAAPSPLVARAVPLTQAAAAAQRTWPSSRVALSPADLREKVWSASDVLSAVRDAQRNGTPDEKLWAVDAARECWFLVHPAPGLKALIVTPGQAAAEAELEKRCAGFKTMPRADRQALEKDLRAGAALSTSDYAQIHAIAKDPEHRQLSDAEMALVENAFYGNDPLLRRDAAHAIVGAIKDQDKSFNMMIALSEETGTPLSTFEVLLQCRAWAEWCGTQQHAIGGPVPEGATPEQLRAIDTIARIRSGVANKMPVRDLIALQ
jgi:hypothetical protein